MDSIIHLFGIATPSENRLSKVVRTAVIEEAAEAGLDLIFTYVWDFSRAKGKARMDSFKHIYESRGGEVLFVELAAPLEERLTRAASPERAQHKPGAPNPARVQFLEGELDYQSPSPFYYPEQYHYINTADLTPQQISDRILALL